MRLGGKSVLRFLVVMGYTDGMEAVKVMKGSGCDKILGEHIYNFMVGM